METLMMFSRIPALLAAAASIPSVADAEEVSFSREIQPILSENCYFCHGPDEAKREAGLRLDTFAGATAERPDSAGPAVVPGDAEASPMIRRMRSRDPEMVMPPPDSHLTVAPEEIAQIARWIDQGAEYETHWAFTPLPEKVAVPTDGDGWARHPIDRFVARAHAAENLEPAPEAPAWKLRRRTALDLTGLPPDLAADGSHEEHTEALLASPHYGEAMALPWLDAARYADSYGYQADKLSPQWPWRDWVIRAFNDNLPYDRFATWQIAGDLLPEASRDQRLATAFNRLHRMTTEGGTVHEEYRIEGVDDRVATFGTAFLALTLDCSRCHDHKYDPITARDYYSLTAFFNSIPERGVYSHSSIAPGPALLVPTPGEEKRLAALRAKREAAQRAHRSHVAAPPETDLEPLTDEIAAFDFQHRGKDGVTPNAVDNREDGKAITARAKQLDAIDSPGGGALRFDGEIDPDSIDAAGIRAREWQYRRTPKYGSPRYRRDGSRGVDPLATGRPVLSKDGRGVFVPIPDLKPTMQLELVHPFAVSGTGDGPRRVAFSARELGPVPWAELGFDPPRLDDSAAAIRGDGPEDAEPTAALGKQVATRFGCIACHSTDGTTEGHSGPTWKGVYGSRRVFADGSAAVADEDYLRTAILDPDTEILEGYQVGMASYAGVLDDAQIDSLILYIQSLR
jgi:mono/diheme cytochrome c family protein